MIVEVEVEVEVEVMLNDSSARFFRFRSEQVGRVENRAGNMMALSVNVMYGVCVLLRDDMSGV